MEEQQITMENIRVIRGVEVLHNGERYPMTTTLNLDTGDLTIEVGTIFAFTTTLTDVEETHARAKYGLSLEELQQQQES